MHTNQIGGPPLTAQAPIDQMLHSLSFRGGPHQFFDNSSFSAALSRCASPSNCFSFSVLRFQLPQPLGLGHGHSAVLGLPPIKRLFADPMTPADLLTRGSRLALGQDLDDLFL